MAYIGRGIENLINAQKLDAITPSTATGVGFQYDQTRDAFIAPKPFNSWTLNEDTCLWEAPVVYPSDGQNYKWNETIQNWELI